MQYDSNLYGQKYALYNDNAGNNLAFYCGSQNISLQSGYTSGAYIMNSNLPDSVFYWQISADSPYSARSYLTRRGSSGSYTYNKYDGDKKAANVPIVLVAGKPKRDSDFNFDESGAFDGNVSMHAYGFNTVSESAMKETNNSGNANWYNTDTLPATQPTQGYFNGYPFIADFDYNNIIVEILVSTSGTWQTLDNYINNSNTATNYIRDIGIQIYAGDKSTKASTNVRSIIRGQKYNSNNVAIINAGVCVPILTDYKYNLPIYVQNTVNYSKDEYSKICGFSSGNDGAMLFSGAVSTSSNSFYVSYLLDNDKWENRAGETKYTLKKTGENDTYSNADFDYIRKLIAYLGFWFTDGGNATSTLLGENALEYDDDEIPTNVYQAEIKDGVTTGNFIPLAIARNNEQSKWGSDWRNKNGYNGRTSGDGKNYDTGNLKTTLRYSDIPSNTKNYALTNGQLQSLITWCNNGFNVTDSNQFLEDFKGLNPSDCIISAIYFPFNVGSLSSASIHVGNLDTGITAEWALYGANAYGGSEFTYTQFEIRRKYNDFRDYAPYTTIDIYIPFCGAVSLNPADVYGYDITISIIPDLNTGSCTGCVYRGDYLLTTKDGQIGMPIALSLGQVGTFQNAVKQAQYNLQSANNAMFTSWLGACASVGAIATGAGAGVGIAGLAGSAMGILNADRNIKKAEYDLEHIARNFNTVGTVSDVNNVMVMPEYVHAIIKRPVDLYPDDDMANYAHTVGYACNKQGQLKDFTGFTIISDCDLSGISCTASEKESIEQILKRGVIV